MANWVDLDVSKLPRSRRSQGVLSLLIDCLAVWDFAACGLSGAAALAWFGPVTHGASRPNQFLHDIVLGSLLAALTLREKGWVNPRLFVAISQLIVVTIRRFLFAFSLLIAVAAATQPIKDWTQLWLAAWIGGFFLAVVATRMALGWYGLWLQSRGALREAVAIVGARGPRDRLAARLAGEAKVVAVYDAHAEDRPERLSPEDINHLLELGREGNVDSVVVAVENEQNADIAELVERLKALPVDVAICADSERPIWAAPDLRIVGGVPMALVAHRPINGRDLLIKTCIDKAGALLLLAVLSPVMFTIAVLIAVTSKGPVIFRQARQGWCGQRFTIFKFRTMHVPPEGSAWTFQTRRHDTRCTVVGRVLRRTSLDELPQLWNVVRGDMSLVGPRPHADILHDMDRAGREIVCDYAQRNRVKPGLTGWAQIHGARGPTTSAAQLRKRVAYDLYYIENWSLWLDLRILARTPFCLMGENVF